MEHLWAPWRMEYIQGEKPEGCFLCEKPKEKNDAANYILYRGKTSYILLNSYPYNPGHMLIAPYRHIGGLDDMTDEERSEHFTLVTRAAVVLSDALKPGGLNIGLNIGRAAGAGVADHIHTHIIPRWNGDTNFMTVCADVRVVPEALAATYQKLLVKFQDV